MGAKFVYYVRLVKRHRHFGGVRQALGYAWRHKAFWWGATASGKPYTHIGH